MDTYKTSSKFYGVIKYKTVHLRQTLCRELVQSCYLFSM